MNTLTLYIGKEILKGSLITLLILLTIFNIFTLADELKDLEGNYGLKQAFTFVAFTSPTVLYRLVPASALIGSLFVLGSMGNNRELVAMQAAGLSVLGIIRSVMLAGLFLIVLALSIGEFVAPVTEKLAQKIKMAALNETIVMNTQYGVWLREGSSYVNVRKAKDDGELADINIFQLNQAHQLTTSIHADTAQFLGNKTWKLFNIVESNISTDAVSVNKIADRIWKSSIAPNLLKIVVVDPNNLSLRELATYVSFLKNNHQQSHTYEAAFWSRAVSPLSTFTMMLVAAPFVIGIHRGISVGARIVTGVVIGLSFTILERIVNYVGLVFELNAPLMAVLPSVAVLIGLFLVLKKVKS